ncbi:hypothetical protein N7537_003986 [Penicillium hordei]|uniref:Fe2OG dioxygenase domain-containing protein n=1 Tax=Penicillium hordei TaxID=40994 RepID=A0AAD6EAJ6_9EURO|nr:uncharacterized protein N7537_003986 [Penicillium hordei]KAJ5607367.1 hypothetical protein N7537_003986 [Penicillium hordei]
MTIATNSSVGNGDMLHFNPVSLSNEDLEWADLSIIDMSTYDQGPEARQALAKQVHDAMTTAGFMVLVNYGISEEEIQRQVDIAHTMFERTSTEEKTKLLSPIKEIGRYRGFKMRKYWEFEHNVTDRIEHFNWYRDMKSQEFPKAMENFLPEVGKFSDTVHKDVLYKLYRLFALSLELPSETFVDKHRFELHDESWFRYMAYYDEFSPDEEAKLGGVWLKGHQDFNTLTLLFSQPMASLQALDDAGNWKYIKHIPGSLVVNCGAYMEWYTGGLYKAAKHRVHAPPKDQRNRTRLGVFYFNVPNDEERPNTLLESPVLQRAGITKRIFELGKEPVSKDYAHARIANTGKTAGWKTAAGTGGVEYDIIGGIKVPLYS